MANSLNGYCGTVSADGAIESNGNFTSQIQSNVGQYYIDYNDKISNPVPIISLTGQYPGMSYVLNAFTGGFRLYVYDNNLVPIASSFDFIVADID
ncbi:MAG: hypothetical protein P1U56_07440 [Saprospiraceae bacterium]|nr:hypothetical protein [Saprospiraceae bacterium]